MIEVNTVRAFRDLAGDAIEAIAHLVRGGSPNVDQDYDDTVKVHDQDYGWHAPFSTAGAMESDGPLLAQPQLVRLDGAIHPNEVRAALDELPDSELLTILATIVEGWKPILFTTDAGRLASRDVDVLVEAVRNRAAAHRAVELDADEPFLTPVHLDDHLTRSGRPASE